MHTTIMRSWMFNVYLNALYAMWNPICLIGRRCNWLIDGTRFGIVYKCAYHLQICSKIWMHAIKRFQFVANAGYDTLFCTIVRCTYHVRSVEFDCYEQRLCEQWVLGAPYVHDARWHAARIYTHESRTCNTKYPSTHPYMYKALLDSPLGDDIVLFASKFENTHSPAPDTQRVHIVHLFTISGQNWIWREISWNKICKNKLQRMRQWDTYTHLFNQPVSQLNRRVCTQRIRHSFAL